MRQSPSLCSCNVEVVEFTLKSRLQLNPICFKGIIDGASSACVATSTDGYSWTKPLLSGHPYHNWTKTNIVFSTDDGWFDSIAVLPTNVRPTVNGVPANAHFVMTFDNNLKPAGIAERALQLATSQDGYTFSIISPPPDLPEFFADTSVALVYRCYVMYLMVLNL